MVSLARRLTVVAAAASVLTIVACGSDPDDVETTPTDPASAPSVDPSRSPVPPVSTASPTSAEVELSGVIRTSPEDRLVTLEASAGSGQPARTWVLLGPVRSLADGDRVTVVGRPDPQADTTAQRGPIFRVTSVERD